MSILKLYAISPIHAGSGASVATVDLPIQRERHTNYPNIQASTLKGALRAHFRKYISEDQKFCEIEEIEINKKNKNNEEKKAKIQIQLINLIFGSDEQDDYNKDDAISGAVSVSDAKLFAFPMRSNVYPFVWVTCPAIIHRLKRDLEFVGMPLSLTKEQEDSLKITDEKAKILNHSNDKDKFSKDKKIILEDIAVTVVSETPIAIDFIKENFYEPNNLLLISDEMFDYCISNCTEIQTNIKIDSKTGTTQDGSLRYQEFLPSDTVLYSVVNFKNQLLLVSKDKDKDISKSEIIKEHVQKIIKDFIQVGGDETLGKGICKIEWIDKNN